MARKKAANAASSSRLQIMKATGLPSPKSSITMTVMRLKSYCVVPWVLSRQTILSLPNCSMNCLCVLVCIHRIKSNAMKSGSCPYLRQLAVCTAAQDFQLPCCSSLQSRCRLTRDHRHASLRHQCYTVFWHCECLALKQHIKAFLPLQI